MPACRPSYPLISIRPSNRPSVDSIRAQSGKTTLLDALAGRLGTKGKLKGAVRFNGETIGAQLRRKVLSYVAQEDTLYGNFTVLETLKFAARFHYGYTISKAQVAERVEVLVERLGLSSCANTIVGDLFRKGLSGECRGSG
jgi:ABC-type multidrug transport system ATPase subunit